MSGYVYIYICVYLKNIQFISENIQRCPLDMSLNNTIIMGNIKQTHPWRNSQTMKLWADLSSSISFTAINSRFLLVPPLKFSLPFQSFHVKLAYNTFFAVCFFFTFLLTHLFAPKNCCYIHPMPHKCFFSGVLNPTWAVIKTLVVCCIFRGLYYPVMYGL